MYQLVFSLFFAEIFWSDGIKKSAPESAENPCKIKINGGFTSSVYLVGVFITDLILMAIRQAVETYSRTAEKVCIYKAFLKERI